MLKLTDGSELARNASGNYADAEGNEYAVDPRTGSVRMLTQAPASIQLQSGERLTRDGAAPAKGAATRHRGGPEAGQRSQGARKNHVRRQAHEPLARAAPYQPPARCASLGDFQ